MNDNRNPLAAPKSRTDWIERVARERLASLLPSHIDPSTLARIVLAEFARTPKLADCTPESVLIALTTCAQFGLIPSGPRGDAYLIPYGNTCTLILGYKGLHRLARNTGEVLKAESFAVYDGERFEVTGGFDARIVHEIREDVRRTKETLRATYTVCKLTNGERVFAVCWKDEIEARRKRGASGKGKPTPWDTDYDAMALKSSARKLYLGGTVPMSAEVMAHMAHEDEIDRVDVIDAGPVNRPRSLADALAAPTDLPAIEDRETPGVEPIDVADVIARLTEAGKIGEAEARVQIEHAKWTEDDARVALSVLVAA